MKLSNPKETLIYL